MFMHLDLEVVGINGLSCLVPAFIHSLAVFLQSLSIGYIQFNPF